MFSRVLQAKKMGGGIKLTLYCMKSTGKEEAIDTRLHQNGYPPSLWPLVE
jgi:hypothetical protein